jgi:hypothetical protein
MSIEVVALLEGMRIVVGGGWCQLDMYDFERNAWTPVTRSRWPLSTQEAEEWLTGWNEVDHFTAINLLRDVPTDE